jgi:hypothetical protein
LVSWWLILLLVMMPGCERRGEITQAQIREDLTHPVTGKVQAARLGWATLKHVRLIRTETRGNQSSALVDVTAEQNDLGTQYALSARLRLHYVGRGREWELKTTETVKEWTRRAVSTGKRKPSDQGSDSAAIEELLHVKKLVRRELDAIPTP